MTIKTPRKIRGNPPPLPGDYPDFMLSIDPWDLSVDAQGRITANPCKDALVGGVLGNYLDRNGARHDNLAKASVEALGRVIIRGDDYKKLYREEDDNGPEQWLYTWDSVSWQGNRPILTSDTEAYFAWAHAQAVALDPTPEQIARAEKQSGRKVITTADSEADAPTPKKRKE